MGYLMFIFGIVVVLGVMVLVHEFGHFLVAKLFGVRVDVFSVGFGPRLYGVRRGDTDYRLSALPVGGYVKMAGDNPTEERTGDAAEFLSKPRWQRFLVVIAGPTMNILTTLILFTWLFTMATARPTYFDKPVENVGVPKDSPAEKAGLHPGDRVTEIDGVKTPDWERAETAVLTATPGNDISVNVKREGEFLPLTMRVGRMAQPCDPYSLIGYPPDASWAIDDVTPGGPAERSGIHPGDQVVSVNGKTMSSWCEFADTIQKSEGHPLQVDVRRGDQILHLQVHPAATRPNSPSRWQLGVSHRVGLTSASLPVAEAARRSGWFTLRLTQQLLSLVGDLFRGRASLKEVTGPIGIMRESGRAAQRSFRDVIYIMAFVGLNLGILNLLPIPILDGGHILMLAIEGLLRRDLSVKIKERFVQVGMVFLLVVFAIVMYNDVLRLIPGR